MGGFLEKYQTTTYAPYSYHLWTGAVSNNSGKGDVTTVNYEFKDGQLTLNPNLSDKDKAKGEAQLITVEAVSGKANTYYIKNADGKYLASKSSANRNMELTDTPAEWVFADFSKGGIQISNNGANLGTAGATYDLLRSYTNANTLLWGVCFFKAN